MFPDALQFDHIKIAKRIEQLELIENGDDNGNAFTLRIRALRVLFAADRYAGVLFDAGFEDASDKRDDSCDGQYCA